MNDFEAHKLRMVKNKTFFWVVQLVIYQNVPLYLLDLIVPLGIDFTTP
jgi:hypothetical protein